MNKFIPTSFCFLFICACSVIAPQITIDDSALVSATVPDQRVSDGENPTNLSRTSTTFPPAIPSPSTTPTYSQTSTISPTSSIPTNTPSQKGPFTNYVTATPFEESDNVIRTEQMSFPECEMRFRYPADWTVELAPETNLGEGCVLDFRPGNWLNYRENAELDYPFYAGQIRYFEDPNLARKNEFWFENGYWYASGSGKPPGEQVDLIKAGDQFMLRAEVEITNINFETGAVSGTRPYLLFFIGNAQGQGIFIRTYPDLIEPGLEVILRTIEFINPPLQTTEARPTTAPPSPTPERTRTPVNYLEKYITATPFYGSNGPSAIFQAQQKCPFQFMYPLDWEVSFDPEYIDTEYCVLSFRPGNWLAYIGEAYLDLPIHAGQIIYWETSSHGAGFRFSYEGGDWYVGGDGIDLGQQIPLIKAGDNYILRGEIYYDGYTRESDAYVGLQDLLIFFISNSKGQSISMESVPDEVEEGLELILRTVTFKDVGE